jgi:hypothetical protein
MMIMMMVVVMVMMTMTMPIMMKKMMVMVMNENDDASGNGVMTLSAVLLKQVGNFALCGPGANLSFDPAHFVSFAGAPVGSVRHHAIMAL